MSVLLFFFCYASLCQQIEGAIAGILYPRESESREVKSLDGIWNFKVQPYKDASGFHEESWFSKEHKLSSSTIPMPVPSSYNDITVNKKIRDYVGLVWYDRKFFVPKYWAENQRVWLRFGSVCYSAQIWINGKSVGFHEIGHLPFRIEVTDYLKYGKENTITVSVDNMLMDTSVPQGYITNISTDNKTVLQQLYTFDFFNYAGIDRPVVLYTTPELYIEDITVLTDISRTDGLVYFRVDFNSSNELDLIDVNCRVTLSDKDGNIVGTTDKCIGKFTIQFAKFWWPYLMHPDPGYLYELKAEIQDSDNTVKDVYRLPVGIRNITWSKTQLLINNRPIYIRGVGKHEDFFIRGKGLDLPLVAKDFNLLKWMGVNTFRTSHYPYAEEIMDFADSEGIMIIDECPSVDTDHYSPTLLQKHKQSLTELFQRDKNRPAVIMWSVANEPRTQVEASDFYFKEIVRHMKSLDNTRPITAALARRVFEDKAGKHLDVISFNRYNGWYSNPGETGVIYQNVIREAEKWFAAHNKPVIMAEYGADAVAGLSSLPETVWAENYQAATLEEHFKAFDYLRKRGFFVGEMVWNFADFQTAQTTTRVGGNKKGMFTRQRDPKAAAYVIRRRYHELAHILENASLPSDLYRYSSSMSNFNLSV